MPYGHGFGIMVIFQVLFFIITIGLITWFVLNSNRTGESAKDLLDKRLANGEINTKEYDRLIKKITR